jgi:hypothetical protein
MSEPTSNKPGWNWTAIWWFFVISLCGATIGAHSMGREAIEMISQRATLPDQQEFLRNFEAQFNVILKVSTAASLAVLLISGFLIPRFFGPWRRN